MTKYSTLTSSALGDGGTNPSDSKSELNLRTFLVMNAINGSGGVEQSEWFSGLFLFSSPFSSVLSSRERLCWDDRGGVDSNCEFMVAITGPIVGNERADETGCGGGEVPSFSS
ncbi:hypothetical protein Tco_0243389 [Tanacetum coccineum]